MAVIAGLFSAGLEAAPLTRAQVAQHAYNAGFRGGALVAAICVAEAESSFEPLAVANNYQRTEADGTKLYDLDGKAIILSISNVQGILAPIDGKVVALPNRRHGIALHHCRGLWQINDSFSSSSITDARAFDPASAAAGAYFTSRGGRHWWKWTSLMNAAAWDPARWTPARAAASELDPLVLPASPIGLRTQAHLRGGWIYSSLGGSSIRQTRVGDTGVIIEGPVVSTIKDGSHTSRHPMLLIAWDSGITGWCAEQFLRRSDTSTVQPPVPAFDPSPAHQAIRVPHAAPLALGWSRGGNTASMSLRFGTNPALNQGQDLKLSNTLATTWTTPVLTPYTNYYWRVDSTSGNGTTTQGTTWTFRTEPLPALPVLLENLTISSTIFPANRSITISGYAFCSGAQTFLLGASWVGPGGAVSDASQDLAITTPANGAGAAFSRTFTLPPSGIHAGSGSVIVSPWRDLNGDGKISMGDHQICLANPGDGIRTAGTATLLDANPPTITNFTVSPPSIKAGGAVTLGLSGADDPLGLGLGRVRFSYINPAGFPSVIRETQLGNAPAHTTSFTHTPTHAGRVSYRAELFDGTFSNSALSATIPVQVADNAPPVVTINFPEQGSVLGSPFSSVGGVVTDFSNVQSIDYRIDGGNWVPLSPGTGFSFTMTFSAGHHRIEVRASDFWQNHSVPAVREIYVRPSATDPDSFDQWLTFDSSEVPVQWTADFQADFPSVAGFVNQRLYAAGNPSLASLRRNKVPPGWASAVETDLIIQDHGFLAWTDNSSPPRTWKMEAGSDYTSTRVTYGETTNLQTVTFPSNFGETKARVVWRNGSLEMRVVSSAFESRTWTYPAPGLNLSTLREMTLGTSANSSNSGSSSIDSVLIRALRPEHEFRVREFSRSPVAGFWRAAIATWPDRLYSLETSTDPKGPWTPDSSFHADSYSGIITQRDIYATPATKRLFVRFRELP